MKYTTEKELKALLDSWASCGTCEICAKEKEKFAPEFLSEVLALRDREKVLVDMISVVIRNIDAGAVHVSWASDYLKREMKKLDAALMTDAEKVEEAKRRG